MMFCGFSIPLPIPFQSTLSHPIRSVSPLATSSSASNIIPFIPHAIFSRFASRRCLQIAVEAKLVGKQRRLILPTGDEISVVYFRAGYTPADYPSSRQWDARTILERSYAIKVRDCD
jgi:hypothetical protein